jgi:CheY-like chemotaxis protein
VLVVDDDAVNREVAACLLESFGMQPVQAFDGAEALQLVVDGQAFDLVLMDFQMPVMNGLEATAQIRHLERERAVAMRLPIVAFTAETIPSDEASLNLLGLDGVLEKPLSAPALESCLQRWCRGTFRPS